MRCSRLLAVCLAVLSLWAGSARAEETEVARVGGQRLFNGGVIILHADYHFMSRQGESLTVVIVVNDFELEEFLDHMSDKSATGVIQITDARAGSTYQAQVRAARGGRIAGRLLGSNTHVMIVAASKAGTYRPLQTGTKEIWQD